MGTTINVVGTIATDPKLIRPSSGVQLCSFRLASDERRYDREQQSWVEGNTNWFGVVVFRSLAGHAHESFKKGDRVIVSGRLRVRKWEKEDRKGISVEIEAEAIGHDVRWGVSSFEKRMGAQLSEDPQGPGELQSAGDPRSVEDAPHAEPVEPGATESGDDFLPRLAA